MKSKVFTKITPAAFTKRMVQLDRDPDQESAHADADELLCQILRENGYGDGVAIFERMAKWYRLYLIISRRFKLMETCYHGVDLDEPCDKCAEEMQRQFIPYKTPPTAEGSKHETK